MAQRVLVTGGNQGVGFALCKQLAVDHGCHVYLGSRNIDNGKNAVDDILKEKPKGAVELVQIDVNSDESVAAAVEHIKASGAPLFALVNNAGIGLGTGGDAGDKARRVLATNLYGQKRVTDAMLPLMAEDGRIVNVGSGAAPMYLRNQSSAVKTLLSSPDVTWDQIHDYIQAQLASPEDIPSGGYGLSKAALHAYTLYLAKKHPSLMINCISPGFIATQMTKGYGARLSPEEGTVSIRHCLFTDKSQLTSGFYYGSDAKRSPFTVTRDPGTPEYEGEDNPDPAKYNN